MYTTYVSNGAMYLDVFQLKWMLGEERLGE